MYIGVDYYPEHWPKSRWATDARLMQEAGFNVVRLFEFNWVNMEPREGEFVFEECDEAITLLKNHGISVILCTPTAVMPAWVAQKYPDTLALKVDGTRTVWGVRKNNCMTSRIYRDLSARITSAMALHYANNPNVIAWQTDNEFGGPYCFCGECRADFQTWLQKKYQTLENLNHAWGTHFWGHRLGEWAQIIIPVDSASFNPGQCLDWQRYVSYQNIRFQAEQIRILRSNCPNHQITHNLMGLFPDINYFDFSKELDFVSWDNYPVWGKVATRYNASMAADLMRGVKKKNFWIMEQSAGPGGWSSFGRNVRPGELRNVSFQQLAHGADGQIWFRWRTCTAGREQYWHGLLGHDGVPLRRYQEAARTAGEYHALANTLKGTSINAKIGIVFDYDSMWALRIQPGFGDNNYHRNMERYYEGLFRAGVNVDMVSVDDDFSKYNLLIAPELHVLPDEIADKLISFVQRGGVLMADFRLAVKTATNLCYDRTLPGKLSNALGITIEEYDVIDKETPFTVNAFDKPYKAVGYVDYITAKTAQIIGTHAQWHVKEFALLTRNTFGKGVAWYLGSPVKEDEFYDTLIENLLRDSGLLPSVKPPAGVEFSVREGNGKKIMFIINHTEEEKSVSVPCGKKELITGKIVGETLKLEAFGVGVVEIQ